jgi:uncharacterized protein
MPELKQEFVVSQPRPKVWAAFQDIETVVGCLPGASLTASPSHDNVKGQMTVKLGPIKANFAGQAEIESDEANYTGLIKGSGIDRNQGSRAKGNVRYVLEESDGGASTKVLVAVTYTLSGALAQFSRGGIVEAVAGRLTEDFAANLEVELSGGDEQHQPAETPALTTNSSMARENAPKRPDRMVNSKELNVFSLLGAVIKGWLKQLFGKMQ